MGTSLEEHVRKYFTNLFAHSVTDFQEIIDTMEAKVTLEHNELLTATFTLEEVKAVVFSMHRDKSPRKDSFNLGFY